MRKHKWQPSHIALLIAKLRDCWIESGARQTLFRDSLKKALNNSRLDRTQREENVNDYVKAFEEETKRLDDHFDHHKSTVADVDSVRHALRELTRS